MLTATMTAMSARAARIARDRIADVLGPLGDSTSGCETVVVGFTVVAFHAHPDDEALLTGGTLARLAAEGHRVVLVTATAGEAGLSSAALHGNDGLGERRLAELQRSADLLGCARLVVLGYPDSGSGQSPHAGSFATLDPAGPAQRLAELLDEEAADALMTYDERGGYRHPDHVQVHRVGILAAELAGTPLVLEATVDRERLQAVARLLAPLPGVGRLIPRDRFVGAYTARSELTHRIDVRRYLGPKVAALAAHATQAGGGGSIRTVSLLVRLPRFTLGPVLGREWFRERGRPPTAELLDDLFASLR